jgi:hypothetical protein
VSFVWSPDNGSFSYNTHGFSGKTQITKRNIKWTWDCAGLCRVRNCVISGGSSPPLFVYCDENSKI